MSSIERAEKFPPPYRYFNISTIWIFYYRQAIRLFYRLRIPHEVITGLSILSGLMSAWFYFRESLVAGAVLLHLKDVFDASDGAVARLTGRGHLVGRYLDSLGDFLVIHAVIIVIALTAAEESAGIYYFWGALTLLSLFLQCSFFNYYQLAYQGEYGTERLTSRIDESGRKDTDTSGRSGGYAFLASLLNGVYKTAYGWQDRLVAAVDRKVRPSGVSRRQWYGNRAFMTFLSPLCFGTHIFVIIVFSLAGRPGYALIFISTVMNFYLVSLLYFRGRAAAIRGRQALAR